MKRQIMHMFKYKYVPFTTGKQVRALAFPWSLFDEYVSTTQLFGKFLCSFVYEI